MQVALRMRQAGISVRAGDTVPYVICLVENMPSGTKSGFAERAYHPDDVMRNNMKLDIGYYLNQQIHPPVARLCAPIDGTDASRLAECLGLDPSKYNVGMRSSEADQSEEFATLDSQISDAERFKNCERLTVKCEHCQTPQEFAGVVREQGEGQTLVSGLQCTSCGNIMSRGCIGSQMILAIRKHIRKYYEGWLICDDTTCRNRTRQMSVFGRRCLRDNCHGAMAREYTDKQLYTQLLYYSSLVDTDKAKTNAYGTSKAGKHTNIHNIVKTILCQSSFMNLQCKLKQSSTDITTFTQPSKGRPMPISIDQVTGTSIWQNYSPLSPFNSKHDKFACFIRLIFHSPKHLILQCRVPFVALRFLERSDGFDVFVPPDSCLR